MSGAELRLDVVLPFGLPDGRGRRIRSAVLTPINGRGELHSAEDANPFRAALHLLASSLELQGRGREEAAPAGLLGELLAVDRDWLVLQLTRLTFGDLRYQTVTCPAEGCGKRVDVCVDLASVTPPEPPAEAVGRVALPDGSERRFRLPNAGDQVALHGVLGEALEAAFLERCLLAGGAPSPGLPGLGEVMGLPAEVRAALVKEILAVAPQLDMTMVLDCVECGQPFRFTYDPVRSLLGELRDSRPALLQEVHCLALSYHWSQAEILGLPRGLRREYLGLIQTELEQRQRELG